MRACICTRWRPQAIVETVDCVCVCVCVCVSQDASVLAERLEKAVEEVKSAYSECPSYDKVCVSVCVCVCVCVCMFNVCLCGL